MPEASPQVKTPLQAPNLAGETVAPPAVSEEDFTYLYGALRGNNAFNKILRQLGDEYLPELIAAHYLRGERGNSPPSWMLKSDPLYERVVSSDPATFEDSTEQDNIRNLQKILKKHDEEGIGFMARHTSGVETMAGASFVPGIIRKHSVATAGHLHKIFEKAVRDNPNPKIFPIYADTMSAINDLLTGDQGQDADPFDSLRLAVHTAQRGQEFIVAAAEKGYLPYATAGVAAGTTKLEALTEKILVEDFEMSQEELAVLQSFKSSSLTYRGVTEHERDFDSMRKKTAALRNNARTKRLVQEPSSVLVDFYDALDDARYNLDPEVVIKSGAGLIAENYAQASKLTYEDDRVDHYLQRVEGFVTDLSKLSEDPDIWQKYQDFIERSGDMPANDEARALQLFKAAQSFAAYVPDKITSLEEFETGIVNSFIDQLTDGSRSFSPEEQNRLVESFGMSAPLLTYGQKHMQSDGYKEALAGLTVSVAEGTYADWHRGDGSEKSLRQMVEAGYFPEQLTLDQYRQWIADNKSDSSEQLVGSAQNTAKIIRDTVELASADVAGLASGYAFKQENLPTVINERNGLGRLLGTLHAVAQRSEGALSSDNMEALKTKLREATELGEVNKFVASLDDGATVGETVRSIQSLLNQLDQLRLLIRIANITTEEVAAGALLKEPAEDGSRKVQQKLQDVLDVLEHDLPADLQFIPQSVRELLERQVAEHGEQQLLTTEDTIDPKVTLEIGANPQRTCQHYETGEFNAGLIGYFGPEVKILIVRNAKGGIIGRSIMRLMQDKQGTPALHVEPVYQSVPSMQITQMLHNHALQKAADMGVELYGKTRSGRVTGSQDLKVRTLKMPAVYSDDGRGINRGSLEVGVSIVEPLNSTEQ